MNQRFFSRTGVCIGLIVLTTLAAYIPAYRAGFIWDDDAHVTAPELRSASGLYRIWFDIGATQQYYPLLHSSFWLQHKLWGDEPLGYHLVNVVLHICVAVLVMLILRRLLRDQAVPWADAAALLTAVVFALHPVHVESVAWITEQKNTLSAVFYLLALWAYLDFDRTRRAGSYVGATALFILSLLAKPVTVTLPAALLIIFWWQRGRWSLKRDVLPLLPWFALSIISGLFAAWVEHSVIGAKGEAFSLSAAQRILLPGRAFWFYLYNLLWPSELIFVYPRWNVDPALWWQWLFPAALLALLIALAALRRRSRAPLAATLFFIGTLFPLLGFFNVYLYIYTFVADHFQYLASLGIIALACSTLAAVVTRMRSPAVGWIVVSLAPIALGVLTFRQCRMYSDEQTLYETILRKNPDCWMAYNNLGRYFANRGRFEEAAKRFRETIRLNPKFPEAHQNLGNSLVFLGRYDEAEAELQEALRLVPHYLNARFSLGLLRERQGRIDDAIAEYRTAVGLNPYFVLGYLNPSQLMIKQGKTAEAIAELDHGIAALHDRPDAAWLYKAKAAILLTANKVDDAIDSLRQAVRLAPHLAEMRLRLANALFQAGKLDAAAGAYVETLSINPDNFQAHYNLAVIRISQGIPQEGLEHLQEAVRLKPDYVDAHFALAQLLEAAGRRDAARHEYEEVLRLAPRHPDAKQRLEALIHPRPRATTSAPANPSSRASDH